MTGGRNTDEQCILPLNLQSADPTEDSQRTSFDGDQAVVEEVNIPRNYIAKSLYPYDLGGVHLIVGN